MQIQLETDNRHGILQHTSNSAINNMMAELYAGIGGNGGGYTPTTMAQNGTTDDSVALSSAIASASGAQATIVISGPVLLGSPITVPSNVQLTFVGKGLLKPAASTTITINGAINAGAWQIFDVSNSGALINGALQNDRVYAEWFGAKADGATDSTTAINNAFALAHASNDIRVQLLAGTYVVTSTLVATGASFTRPNIQGISKKQTILSFTGIAASSVCLKVRGGSGQITGDAVSDLTLVGNSTSILLEFNGACGAKGRNLLLNTGATGVRWHNEAASSFTEFCTLEGCEIQTGVTLPFEYKVTSGNNSFHGSGPGGSSENIVVVGAGTSAVLQADGTGTFIYNAPCNLQVFATAGNTTIFQNNNSVAPVPIAFSGALSIETSTSRTITLGGNASVYFMGPIKPIGATNLTGDNIVAGTMLRVDTVTVHGDGSTSFTGAKRATKLGLTIPAASMAAINMPTGAMDKVGRLVDVNVFATNYLSQQLVLTGYAEGTNNPGATLLGQHGNFNNPGGTTGYQAVSAYTGNANGTLSVNVPTIAKVASGAFTGGETSVTFTLSWQSPTGTYNLQFSNGDVRAVACTQGSAGPFTWTGGLSGAATTAITAQTWPNGSGVFSAYLNEAQVSNGIQQSGHMQF